MKTKLLFALSLLLCFITSAQRIDYALNHQDGGAFVQPNLLKVVNENLLMVSYSLTNNGIERKNMLSIMASDGSLLKTTTVNYVYEGDVIAIDFLSNGYVTYVKRTFNKTCVINARLYDVNLYFLKEINLYQGDSVNNVQFDCYNRKFASLINGVILRVGNLNEMSRTAEMIDVRLDSLPIRLQPTLRWMTDFETPTLYLWSANHAQLFSFDDSLKLTNTSTIRGVSNPIFFNKKLYSSYIGQDNQTGYYFNALIDSLGNEVNRIRVSVSPIVEKSKLICDKNYLFVFTSIGHDFDSRAYNDSTVLTWIAVDLTIFRQIVLPSIQVVSASSDNLTSLFLMGWNGAETVIHKFDDGSICIGLSEMVRGYDDPTVYPNPASNTLNFSEIDFKAQVQLFNTQGQLVLNTTQTQNIDVSQLPSGLYFYKITNTQNQAVAQGKIVKQ